MELVISRTFIDFISIVYLTYCFTLSHVHNGTYGREICFKSIKRSQGYHGKKKLRPHNKKLHNRNIKKKHNPI